MKYVFNISGAFGWDIEEVFDDLLMFRENLLLPSTR